MDERERDRQELIRHSQLMDLLKEILAELKKQNEFLRDIAAGR
jgi:hypothetical protein